MPTEGDPIENPRYFRTAERALAKTQRKHQMALEAHTAVRSMLTTQLARTQPDLGACQVWDLVSQDKSECTAWRERQHRQCVVARVHERIRWQRGDFAHQECRKLVTSSEFLAVEELSVRQMMANHQRAKSIRDAAWTLFAALIACKAARAGRRSVAVTPRRRVRTALAAHFAKPT